MLQECYRNFGLLKFGKDLVNIDNSLISKEQRILLSIIGNSDKISDSLFSQKIISLTKFTRY